MWYTVFVLQHTYIQHYSAGKKVAFGDNLRLGFPWFWDIQREKTPHLMNVPLHTPNLTRWASVLNTKPLSSSSLLPLLLFFSPLTLLSLSIWIFRHFFGVTENNSHDQFWEIREKRRREKGHYRDDPHIMSNDHFYRWPWSLTHCDSYNNLNESKNTAWSLIGLSQPQLSNLPE